jgi:amidohydrolase
MQCSRSINHQLSKKMRLLAGICVLVVASFWQLTGLAENAPAYQEVIDWQVEKVADEVLAWRRDIHEHPELGNRETRTAGIVADHLRALGFDEVRTGIAHTGVVGILKGARPGKVVALRADMDALPVTERVELPFASKVRTRYNGQEVGVMHACGHDVHTSVLMGTASVLAAMREEIAGTVVFIFQPAEEGAPIGENGGASMMIEQGVLDNPKPEAIFGLHTSPAPVGIFAYRSGGIMAGADDLRIAITGRQTHGGVPWGGVDPIVTAAQVVLGLQTIVSRQVDVTTAPTVITIGKIQGGVRHNIIPERVEMHGTIRILEPSVREDVLSRVRKTVIAIAESAGAKAEVEIEAYAPVTYNDPDLTRQMIPTLERIAPIAAVETPPVTPSEDFAFFQKQIPGVYFFLGVGMPDPENPGVNHSPYFRVDEASLPIGVRAMSAMAMDYLSQ